MTATKPEGRGDPSAEEDKRQLAAKLVNALYRVIKACQIHAEHNQAVTQVIEQAVLSASKFCEKSGIKSVAILFTPHAVFINRQMMRASKETYQLALELGTLLLACDATEVTLTHDVSAGEISEFGRAAANASRDGKPSIKLRNGGWDGLRLRRVQGLGAAGHVAPATKAARTFAAALMILKSFYGDLRSGNYEPRQGVKRISQKLVSASELEARLLLSIAAVPSVDPDRTQTLLATAIVALAMANQLATDRSLLSAIVTAALLHDVGRPRIVGHSAGVARTLNADEEALQLSSSVVAITALGKLHPPNLTRAVLVHETHAMQAGIAPYRAKRTPLLASRIIALARTFVELRTPTPTAAALTLDDAVQVLDGQAADNTGRALIKLLVGALGLFPAGTMVELSTGEMGVVLATPSLPVDFARPPVRILYDESAQLLPEPLDIDLATEPRRTIRKAIDSTDQQMRQMRSYVMQLASKRSQRRDPEEPPASIGRDSIPSDISSMSGGSFGSAAFSTSSNRVEPPVASSSPVASSATLDKWKQRKVSTMRWDPREEESSAGAPAQGFSVDRGLTPQSPKNPQVPQATRSVSWGELNKELEASIEEAKPAPESETDSILAAYLADESANRASSQGDQSRSHGLRWTSSGGKSNSFDPSPSSGGHTNAPPSSGSASRSGGSAVPAPGGFADSRGGEDPWDEIFAPPPPVEPASAREAPKHAPPPIQSRASSAPQVKQSPMSERATPPAAPILREAFTPSVPVSIRTIEDAPSGAPPSQSPRSTRTLSASSWAAPPKSKRVEVELVNTPEPSPPTEAPASSSDAAAESARERRAKAGSAAWGSAKKEAKK